MEKSWTSRFPDPRWAAGNHQAWARFSSSLKTQPGRIQHLLALQAGNLITEQWLQRSSQKNFSRSMHGNLVNLKGHGSGDRLDPRGSSNPRIQLFRQCILAIKKTKYCF